MATELTIGKLADAAGVNVETIRYYQRRGLLDEPAKPLGGHRRYPVDMVKRLRFIKRAQALGFTLSEVGGLLTLDESCACAETRLCCTNPRADALTPTPDGLMPRHPPARSAAGRSD